MNEQEMKAFRIAFDFYSKWRGTVIETDEQWLELAEDYGRAGEKGGDCLLLDKLLYAALETLSELYKNGMKPMPANYFWRDDM